MGTQSIEVPQAEGGIGINFPLFTSRDPFRKLRYENIYYILILSYWFDLDTANTLKNEQYLGADEVLNKMI